MQSNNSMEAFNSINHKLSQLPKIGTKPSIHRVHKELRDVNNSAYEPKLIAIGPYHHGKDNLKMMEEHKLLYLQSLLKSQKQNVNRYISAIGELEQEARDCYAEYIGLNGAQFVEMLVLDGCFIIELARKHYNKGPTYENDPIFQMQWLTKSLLRDLILFENQIPFFVLCKLFDLIEGENKHDALISYLLLFCWRLDDYSAVSEMSSRWSSEVIKHLHDLVYRSAGFSSDDIYISIERDESSLPLNKVLKFIPSATELKNANVEFHKKQGDAPFEVKFENGIMEMPPFTIEDATECVLRNFIAYEQYFLNNQRNIVTDYVTLLDCLINSSRDVEILSECGVINNWLGDNEVVANIINRLADSVIVLGEHFVYARMFDDVNRYYKKGWNRSMAMLRRDIFHSPWAYISFFAALAIVILTIVQTICSILQVV